MPVTFDKLLGEPLLHTHRLQDGSDVNVTLGAGVDEVILSVILATAFPEHLRVKLSTAARGNMVVV